MVKSTTYVRRSWQLERCSRSHRGARDGTKPVQEEPHTARPGAATRKPKVGTHRQEKRWDCEPHKEDRHVRLGHDVVLEVKVPCVCSVV